MKSRASSCQFCFNGGLVLLWIAGFYDGSPFKSHRGIGIEFFLFILQIHCIVLFAKQTEHANTFIEKPEIACLLAITNIWIKYPLMLETILASTCLQVIDFLRTEQVWIISECCLNEGFTIFQEYSEEYKRYCQTIGWFLCWDQVMQQTRQSHWQPQIHLQPFQVMLLNHFEFDLMQYLSQKI